MSDPQEPQEPDENPEVTPEEDPNNPGQGLPPGVAPTPTLVPDEDEDAPDSE